MLNKEKIVNEKYSFQYALTDEAMQKRIIEFIMPIKDSWDICNLQLAYGVLEKNNDIFVTRTKTKVREDDDTGKEYETTFFVALVGDKVYGISYVSEDRLDERIVSYDVPSEHEEVLIQALDFWRNYKEHHVFEKKLEEEDNEFSMLSLNADLRRPLYDLIPEPLPIEKKTFAIHSVEDAKTLFYLCKTDCDETMEENYDEETIAAFRKYGNRKQQNRWIVEECEEILKSIIAGNTEKLYRKLDTISHKCYCWLSDPDDMADLYTEMCTNLFSQDIYIPLGCICSYLCIYKNRFNPLHCIRLIDLVEKYLKEKHAEEYEKGDYASEVQRLKRTCVELRGIIEEVSEIENSRNFRFIHTNQEILDSIVNYYQEKSDDFEEVKEELEEMNCIYGVQNEEIFLTALSDAADSLSNESWDEYFFVAILQHTNEVINFECRRDKDTGKLYLCQDLLEMSELVMDAVRFFRNKNEREKFFEYYDKNDVSQYELQRIAHKELFRKIGSSFQELLDRIGDNPIKDSLEKFVELCESEAPRCGVDGVIVEPPATDEDIREWERANGVKLPENYCNFLKFANGYRIRSSSEYIVGLDNIEVSCKHLDSQYMFIGGMIGDGTTLCLSKTTGKAFVEDHGEYEEYDDFIELFDYVIEYASEW